MLFGLLGKTLKHSYSPEIHALLADYEYKLVECGEERLNAVLHDESFSGFNVTIPYKKAVVPFLDEISATARRTASVNTVVRRSDGTLFGDNTDVPGFIAMIRRAGIDVSGKKTLVLGSGGASAAVCLALETLGARWTVISRSGENNYGNLGIHADAEIIVNATPVGMYPENGRAPLDLTLFPDCRGVADVIYNPAKTALLLQAERLGIKNCGGLYMLVAQAKRSAELFLGREIPDGETDRVEGVLSKRMKNIVLIGMPGCGKTTVAAALAAMTGREAVDSDAVIEERTGRKISDYIPEYGEDAFRRVETEVLSDLGRRSGLIIATGGGCVTREENRDLLRQNGTLFHIERDLSLLGTDGRPLSQKDGVAAIYEKRKPLYESFRDFRIENDGSPEDTARKITELMK